MNNIKGVIMAISLINGRHFLVEYKEKPSNSYMVTSDIYTEYYGIGYIVSGDRQISTPEQTFYVHKGYISPMTMNTYHRTSPISNEPYCRYGIRFTPDRCKRLIKIMGKEQFDSLMANASYELPANIQKDVLNLFEQMLTEYNIYDKYSEIIIEGMLEKLITIIHRYGFVTPSNTYKIIVNDPLIIKLLNYVNINYRTNFSTKELAAFVGLSPSHFMKRFKLCVGSTYKTYINHYRIQMSQYSLINTTKSIQEISDEFGFCNSNYYCKLFKQYEGVSPKKFRENMINMNDF